MGELILHIGTRKTGTTALQKFFYDNREVFLKNGVDYTQFTRQKTAPHVKYRNGIFLSEYCRALSLKEKIDNNESGFEENYNRLKEALKGDSRILISDEQFANYSTMKCDAQYEPETYWREMAHIVKGLEPSQTTIIVYLRRQDEFVVSSWKERIASGWIDMSFREYLNRADSENELNYNKLLDAIKSSFGPSAKIIVRSYNQVIYSGEDIFHDFCESLGIAWDSDFRITKERMNLSISFDMAEALLNEKFGGIGRSIEEKRVRKRLAVMLCRNHPDPKGTTIFVTGEAERLVEEFSDGNRIIEEVYFDNKKLFSDEFTTSHVWRPNRFRIAMYRIAFLCLEPALWLRSIFRTSR